MAGLPTPLSASHWYEPASSLVMLFNGNVTSSLFFDHVMFAGGGPVALQVRITDSPSFTVVLEDMKIISGGPERKKYT